MVEKYVGFKAKTEAADPLNEAEAAVKALREAKDPEGSSGRRRR